jgi:hypothetical protein
MARLEDGGPPEFVLAQVLDASRSVLAVSALAARDENDRIVAATQGAPLHAVPARLLRTDDLLPADTASRALPHAGAPLPADGGRIPLIVRNRRVGWLDVWGDGQPADAETRRTLSDVARLTSMWLTWR